MRIMASLIQAAIDRLPLEVAGEAAIATDPGEERSTLQRLGQDHDAMGVTALYDLDG